MNKTNKWLYLPIDVKNRELDAKIMLALLAGRRGWNVVLGQKKDVSHAVSHLPPGVFVGFGAHKNFTEKYKRIKERGGRVATFDEEGLVTWSPEIFGKMRISDETVSYIDTYFCWGHAHENIVKEVNDALHKKCAITGNPRLDVLRPEFSRLYAEEAYNIRRSYGDFILINSNFGTCNHYLGTEAYFQSLIEKKIITSPEREQFYRDYIAYRTKILESFFDLLPILSSAFPDKKIIVRPHPSEKRDGWHQAAKGLTNVEVIHEGAVIPWLIAARAIVHNFCTTAVESYILRRPVFAYRPIVDNRLETELPSMVSTQVFDEDTLIEKLDFIFSSAENVPEQRDQDKIEYYIRNMTGPLSADSMLDILDGLAKKIPPDAQKGVFIFKARNIKEKLQSAVLRSNAKKPGYIEHKFPTLTSSEIHSTISKMPSDLRDDVAVNALYNGTYLFRKK